MKKWNPESINNKYYFIHKKTKDGYGKYQFVLLDTNYDFAFLEKVLGRDDKTDIKNFFKVLGIENPYLLNEIVAVFEEKMSSISEMMRLDEQTYEVKVKRISDDIFITNIMQITQSEENEALLFKLMFQNVTDAMAFIKKGNTGFEYVFNNRAHEQLTGFSSQKIYKKNLCDVLGKDYYKNYEEYCEKSLRERKTIAFLGTALFNGEEKTILCRLTPIVYDGGDFIVANELDSLSVREWMMENKLSLTKFDAMFSLHTAVMLLIDPVSGSIVDANPVATDFYGYSVTELKQMSIQDINLLPSEKVQEYREQAMKKSMEHFLFEHKLKSGAIKYVDVYSSPIDLDGNNFLFSIIVDVTEQESNKQALFKEKELLDITLESIGDGVVTTDMQGNITRINTAALEVLHWEIGDVIGHSFEKVFKMENEYTGELISNIVSKVLRTNKKQELANHTVLYNKFGYHIPIEDSAAPILDEYGELHGVVVVFRDVSLAREKKKEIEYLSYHDPLTGLNNRRFYYEQVSYFDKKSEYPLAVIMGDVNGLKLTNDVFGHERGDQLLVMISNVIKDNVNERIMVTRWGGDEFVILIPNTDAKEADDFIKRIKKNLSNERINGIIGVSISFGYAIKRHEVRPMDVLLKEAEEMMYRRKLLESKSMRGSMINTLLATLNEKSAETKEHTLRLKKNCLMIGDIMNLDTETKNELSLLSVLHDIGKIGIPEHILMKPGPLNPEEWKEMKAHPEIGYRIASNVSELSTVAKEILCHHEKWDGSGYPGNLKGEKIPINCRILAVVDAYDAMTNDRIYRRAMKHEEAVLELKRYSGTQFDPQVVEIFLSMIE
ncbi:MAG: HD domain-containing phosphohydrolase [Velocimicrobium sp.]